MSDKAVWLGHEFNVYDPEITDWNEVGGLYIFAGLVSAPPENPQWFAYYIGETEDFAKRLPTHEDWLLAVELGATHVHTMTLLDAWSRAKAERELIREFQPPVNVLLKE